jgi:actin-like ATPase involved in cell morphogenesis
VGYGLGVDLGTTFTGVAIARYGRTRIVPLSDDPISARSMLAVRPAGALLVREVDDTVPVVLGGRAYPAVAVLAGALRSVLDAVTASEGEPPQQVVLTCPAVWGPARRQQFGEVSRRAGLASVTVVSEPEAAVTALVDARRLAVDDVVVVYDLGGVTADMTVIRVTGSGMEILGLPEGADAAGGADFDDLILAHVDRAVGGVLSRLDLSDPVAAGVLTGVRAECVRAKEALSRVEEATVRVVGLAEVLPPVRLTRAEFEAMIRTPIRSTLSGLRRVLDSAGVEAKDLTAVVLVGGSSRIPSVSRMLADTLGRPVLVDDHPQHCVALGAAAIAAGSSVNSDGALRITPGAPPVTDGIPSIAVAAALMAAAPGSAPSDPPSAGGTAATGPVRIGPVRADPTASIRTVTPFDAPVTPERGVAGAPVDTGIFPGGDRPRDAPVDLTMPGLFRRAGGHRMPRMGDWRRRAGVERHGVEERHWLVIAVAVLVALLVFGGTYVLLPLFTGDNNGLDTRIVESPGGPEKSGGAPEKANPGEPDPPAADDDTTQSSGGNQDAISSGNRKQVPPVNTIPTGAKPTPPPLTGPVVGLAGKCLDVVDGEDANGSRVQLLGCIDSPAQEWTAPGDGTLRSQGKCLQIIDVGTFEPRLEINKCTRAAGQQWELKAGTIVNPPSGTCLDVQRSSSRNRTPVITSVCIDGPGQHWTLRS